MKSTLICLISACLLTGVAHAQSPDASARWHAEGFAADQAYTPTQRAMVEINHLLAEARAQERLALIVLGGHWCHDSQALAERFEEPDLQAVIEAHYVTGFIGVGGYEHGFDVVRRFGPALYYATPTVLIVDPHTERLLNQETMFIWRDAARLTLAETIRYFENEGVAQSIPRGPSTQEARLLTEIQAFEAGQAAQIAAGYELIGPLLLLDGAERPAHFNDLWALVRDRRYALMDALDDLHTDLRQRLRDGEDNIQLDFPVFEPLNFEEWSTP